MKKARADGTGSGGKMAPSGKPHADRMEVSGGPESVESQVNDLVKGLLDLDRADWREQCGALIKSMDELAGALPGQKTSEEIRKSYENATVKAASAVSRAWQSGPPKSKVLVALFPGKAETEASRQGKFVRLLEYAKRRVESGDILPLGTKDSNPVNAALAHAWEPLGPWDKKGFEAAVAQADRVMAKPDRSALGTLIPLYPCVARWLAVMRQDQLSDAKKRA